MIETIQALHLYKLSTHSCKYINAETTVELKISLKYYIYFFSILNNN